MGAIAPQLLGVEGLDGTEFGGVVEKLSVFDAVGEVIEMEVAIRPRKHMDIEAVGFGIISQTAVFGGWDVVGGGGASVDGAAVPSHPVADPPQAFPGAVVKLAAGGGSHIEKEIAPLADTIHESTDQFIRGPPAGLVPMIAPGTAEGLTGFPNNFLPIHCHPFPWLNLFRGFDVPGIRQIEAVV